MAGEEWRTAESGGVNEDREREDEARRARAEAEAERAAAEREGDRGEGGDEAEPGVLPAEEDEARSGVMRPPAGGS
jgi:hypothetical protein